MEGCYFGNQTMSAVQLNPDALWLEGGPVSSVTLQNNVFEGTGRQWAGQGAISIDAMVTSDGQNETSATGIVDHGVQIQNNTFRNCYGPAVAANAIGGLVIGQNTMQNMPAQVVVLQNVQDVQVNANTCSPSGMVQVAPASSGQVALTGNNGLSLQLGGS